MTEKYIDSRKLLRFIDQESEGFDFKSWLIGWTNAYARDTWPQISTSVDGRHFILYCSKWTVERPTLEEACKEWTKLMLKDYY